VGLLGVGEGYAEQPHAVVGQLGVSAGWLAQVEAGWHPVAAVDLFGFGRASGQWGAAAGWQAGAGARIHW